MKRIRKSLTLRNGVRRSEIFVIGLAMLGCAGSRVVLVGPDPCPMHTVQQEREYIEVKRLDADGVPVYPQWQALAYVVEQFDAHCDDDDGLMDRYIDTRYRRRE